MNVNRRLSRSWLITSNDTVTSLKWFLSSTDARQSIGEITSHICLQRANSHAAFPNYLTAAGVGVFFSFCSLSSKHAQLIFIDARNGTRLRCTLAGANEPNNHRRFLRLSESKASTREIISLASLAVLSDCSSLLLGRSLSREEEIPRVHAAIVCFPTALCGWGCWISSSRHWMCENFYVVVIISMSVYVCVFLRSSSM